MAQIMRHHDSDKKGELISRHFETLSVIIPHLAQTYVKDTVSNLVEIDYEEFTDVDRYVFLYEFYEGGFSRRRAVVDFVKRDNQEGKKIKKNQIIDVDWRELGDNEEFLRFPK